MTSKVLFLITPGRVHNDNASRLPDVFRRHGWQVTTCTHEELSWRGDQVYCAESPATHFNLIWPIGLGPQQTFLDRITLLEQIDPQRLISHPHVYVSKHGKTAWHKYAPPTFIAAQAEPLITAFESLGGPWVMKPVAGSFGEQVQRVEDKQTITHLIDGANTKYWMLQRYVPEIVSGETRTLVCGQSVIGSYLRTPTDKFHANLAAHGLSSPTTLSRGDLNLVDAVQQDLCAAGVGFAAIDTVGGYLMEVNVANPGGLGTLRQLYGQEIEARFMQAINQRFAD